MDTWVNTQWHFMFQCNLYLTDTINRSNRVTSQLSMSHLIMALTVLTRMKSKSHQLNNNMGISKKMINCKQSWPKKGNAHAFPKART